MCFKFENILKAYQTFKKKKKTNKQRELLVVVWVHNFKWEEWAQ